jgi:hypothetical protein
MSKSVKNPNSARPRPRVVRVLTMVLANGRNSSISQFAAGVPIARTV